MESIHRSLADLARSSVSLSCCYLGIACLLLPCESHGSEREALLAELNKPENVQTFSYADFGPEALVATSLKESGILGKKRSEVKVLVFTGGELETQYLLMQDEGELDKEGDYRLLWYPEAVKLLDDVLEEKSLSDQERATVTATRERLIKKMGDREAMMKRYKALKKPIKAVALKTGRARETEFRKRLQQAQLEYLKSKSQE